MSRGTENTRAKDGSSDALAATSYRGGWHATHGRAITHRTARDIQPENTQQIAAFKRRFAAAIMRLPETRRGSRNLTRMKTNISRAAHSHYTPPAPPPPPPPPGPHFSLKHFMMTEQTNPDIFGLFGFRWKGRRVQISNHILFLLLYVWLGGGWGEGGAGTPGCR